MPADPEEVGRGGGVPADAGGADGKQVEEAELLRAAGGEGRVEGRRQYPVGGKGACRGAKATRDTSLKSGRIARAGY
eukprot:1428352-Pyramimonas_sp.AAC.1